MAKMSNFRPDYYETQTKLSEAILANKAAIETAERLHTLNEEEVKLLEHAQRLMQEVSEIIDETIKTP